MNIFEKLQKKILLLKEGAIVGLIIGLLIFFFRAYLGFLIDLINSWWGPFTTTQLFIVILYLCMSAGIIFDFLYKPKK